MSRPIVLCYGKTGCHFHGLCIAYIIFIKIAVLRQFSVLFCKFYLRDELWWVDHVTSWQCDDLTGSLHVQHLLGPSSYDYVAVAVAVLDCQLLRKQNKHCVFYYTRLVVKLLEPRCLISHHLLTSVPGQNQYCVHFKPHKCFLCHCLILLIKC